MDNVVILWTMFLGCLTHAQSAYPCRFARFVDNVDYSFSYLKEINIYIGKLATLRVPRQDHVSKRGFSLFHGPHCPQWLQPNIHAGLVWVIGCVHK